MKKSLLAVAAIGAFASAAQAQSSVTVYGVMDVGYVGATNRAANPMGGSAIASPGGINGTGVTSGTTSAITGGAESTNRLGFKGTEDLGGGLSAFFTVEIGLDPNQSQVISTGGQQNRQSFLGMKKNGIGSAAIGTQYTTIHNAVAATDPGMQNNMAGNVIYDKQTGGNPSASNQNNTLQFSGQQNNTSYTVRAKNMLSLSSDTFAGFQANAFYVLNNSNQNQLSVAGATAAGYAASSGSTNQTGWGLGANYTWQKLFVTANFQQFTDKNPYTINTATNVYSVGAPSQNGYAGWSTPGTNDKDNQQYYAATYDFGILKAYVQYVNRKTMDANNPNNYVARTAQQLGVRSFVTPTIESWASVGTGKMTVSSAANGSNGIMNAGNATGAGVSSVTGGPAGAGSNAVNFGGFQLGSNYWLSKRTNLYAIYGQQRTSNQSWNAGANPTSYNSNNYAVGVRHTF
jgi:predicted porin